VDEEWAWDQKDYVTWELTIIVIVKRTGTLAIRVTPVEVDDGKESALLIFRSRLEAQAFREDLKLFAGHGIVTLDQARIAGLLGSYDLRWVAMADSWDEGGDVVATTFDGDRFLKLLDEGIKD
jgi:hypothetical protein